MVKLSNKELTLNLSLYAFVARFKWQCFAENAKVLTRTFQSFKTTSFEYKIFIKKIY